MIGERTIALFQIAFVLLSALAASELASIDIGVNYGRLGNDLPSPAEVVQLYQRNGIGKMRLFDPDPSVLQALMGSQINLTLGIRNEDLPIMAANAEAANSWFATNVEPYLNDIVFSYIVVGNEVLPGKYGNYVLPVMQQIQNILTAKNLAAIKVSTAVPAAVLGTSYPPSQSAFSEASRETMAGILHFLCAQGSPLLINAYPYFAYASDPEHINLDYALFNAKDTLVQDGNLGYWNMLDAILDAFFWEMEQLGINNVDVVVSKSGWPSDGNGNFTTPSLAATYNQNFVRRIISRQRTPERPNTYIEGFIFAFFNENLKPGGVEQHFGLFYPNMQPVYQVFPLSN